ncbi:iron-containing alcohol dehydrogenase [Pantoea stewartii]|uniref:Alcohol dehydrogenase n=1 Tax=Pantoea stewartii subsp. stewartii DC283 TaxID=660596 RepID=H3RKA7_PANSE|nr:iron-containing alcohol dehydrogenase [Pantoea stewartii]ARF52589.1 alcohol dehydrogenase [Pantoea stewartii subsp. stewartii DC283]EHT98148.1 alcohol dehydrogenase [Pantoea stewartii subsp. stewartii DC283]KAB0546310.1 iron-containing alcohol dehydrogenase [Pantoea stewartii subsp. stewartii]KHE01157.1 DhaT [Pantoea stewartii]KHN63452.1 DhaT [Pantoea stewartii]
MALINSTILSGSDAIKALTPVVADKQHLLVLTDKNIVNLPATTQIMTLLSQDGRHVKLIDDVPAEPTHTDVEAVLSRTAGKTFDLVVGIGGGSVLDVAKLLSVLCHVASPSLKALLDGVKITARLPSLLIPSTAGTGSEATPNAILAIPEKNTKSGIISPVMLPDYVALIPELTTSMPAHIASSTGIDALCHLLECYTATISNPVGDNVALMGLHKLFRNLETSVTEPHNLNAKLEMLWASYYGGAAIAHAGTHLVHALSYPLGGTYHLPHGVANAILLAPCMKVVRPFAIDKFATVWDLIPGADITLTPEEKSHALVDYLAKLVKRLNLPDNLETLGVPSGDIDALSESALNVKRLMNNSPCAVNHQDVADIYRTLFPKI